MRARSVQWRSALLEGFGVLLGILIAFGIDAAWDTRQDRERASAYLDALASELATNRATFEGYLATLGSSDAADAAAIRRIVFGDSAVTSRAILEWTTESRAAFMVLPERAALSDVLSSGGITFIEDPAVRRLISRYAQRLDRQLVAQEDLVGHWRGRMVQYYEDHASLYDMARGVPWYTGGLPLDAGSFDIDVRAFAGNRQFANLLVHQSILNMMARMATNDLLEAIDQLAAALEGAG